MTARVPGDFIAVQSQCLSEKCDCELTRIEKLEIFRSFPGPENRVREAVFIDAVSVRDFGARNSGQLQSGGEHENGKLRLHSHEGERILREDG